MYYEDSYLEGLLLESPAVGEDLIEQSRPAHWVTWYKGVYAVGPYGGSILLDIIGVVFCCGS